MRLTGGVAKGRVVPVRVGPGVRPTSGRVREALFSMVGQDLRGKAVLDAFSGAGVLGFEAWSRGGTVVAVERHRATASRLGGAARQLGADHHGAWTLRVGDVRRVVGEDERFDLVLADPPYAEAPEAWLEWLAARCRSWLVYESPAQASLPDAAGELRLRRVRSYGGTKLWIYRVEATV